MRWIAAILVMGMAVVSVVAQTAAVQKPQFEVVSIKSAPRQTPELIRSGYRPVFEIDASRVRIVGFTPFDLLVRAFRVGLPQIDAPDFARDEYFEIQATLPPNSTREQFPEMLQSMLAERFKLAYHREIREYRVNVLTVGKNGMKLARLPDGTQVPSTSTRLADGSTRITQTGNVKSLFPLMNSFGGLQMEDETGLDGIYTWVRTQPPASPGMTYKDVVQEGFKSMIEAAGLKLDERTVRKETIVVDHLEKVPTEN